MRSFKFNRFSKYLSNHSVCLYFFLNAFTYRRVMVSAVRNVAKGGRGPRSRPFQISRQKSDSVQMYYYILRVTKKSLTHYTSYSCECRKLLVINFILGKQKS